MQVIFEEEEKHEATTCSTVPQTLPYTAAETSAHKSSLASAGILLPLKAVLPAAY